MAVDDRLSDLLVEWEQGRRAGLEPSLEELCRDTPDLLPVVKESIDSLKATDWMFRPEPNESFSSDSAAADCSRAALHDTELPASHLTVQEFAASIFQSGLLSRAEIDELKDRLDASALPGEAREVASRLVTEGKLTRYQASVLLKASKDPLLVDNYVILDTLDTGGMGLVFKALHRSMNRVVALKLLPSAMMSARDTVKRFQREVQAAAALKHPNIVAAFDADESEEIAYLVLEYIEGTNLFRLVKDRGPLPIAQAADYVRQAATGLAYLHSRGIIHRDVKPANLILANDGTVKLLDMGLVRFASSEDLSCAEMDQELTQAGIVIGTVAYMSPEQALDTRSADQRSDIYSLGCTLFFLLTGRSLYHEETGMKTLLAHREQPVPSIREFCEEAPVSLDAVFRTMVAKRPADRLQTMEEVIAAIDACVPGLSPSGNRSTRPMPSSPPMMTAIRRNRLWQSRRFRVGAVITVLAAAVVAGVYLAVILIRIKTSQGTTEVSVNDPNAKIEIATQSERRPEDNQGPKASNRRGNAEPSGLGRSPSGSGNVRFGLGGMGIGLSRAKRGGPVHVVTATARKGDFKVYLSGLFGTVTASQTVSVRTRVDGEITKVFFKEGQIVHAGDSLVEIDDRPYKTRLAQAHGQLLRDQASLTQATRELKRDEELKKINAGTPTTYDAQVALVGRYDGAVKNDQAMVEDAKLQLTYCHITAPFSGRIGLRPVDQGNLVQAASATNLAVIMQLQPIAVVFPLPQDQIFNVQQKLNSGKDLVVEALSRDGDMKLGTGKLVGIDNQVDLTTGTVRLKALFANENNRMFPGENMSIQLLVDTLHDVVIVPTTAVQHAANETFAYVVKPDNTVERRKLVIGPSQKDESVVTSSLSAGEVVVVEGADKLEDNSKVELPTPNTGATSLDRRLTDLALDNSGRGNVSSERETLQNANSGNKDEIPSLGPVPPAPGSTDRAWAEWLFSNFEDCRILTDVAPEIWVEATGNLPAVDFHITQIEFVGRPPQPGQAAAVHLNATIVRRLAELPALEGLSFSDPVIVARSESTRLKFAGMERGNVSDEVLKAIGGMTRLTGLRITSVELTDDRLKDLAGLTRLSALDLTNCRNVHGSGFKDLSGLTKLKALNLAESGLNDQGLSYVGQFAALESLNLRGTWISNASLSQLAGLSHLQELILYNCRRIDNGAIRALSRLQPLQKLNLNETRVTVQVVAEMQDRLPHCRITWPPDVEHNAQYQRELRLEQQKRPKGTRN